MFSWEFCWYPAGLIAKFLHQWFCRHCTRLRWSRLNSSVLEFKVERLLIRPFILYCAYVFSITFSLFFKSIFFVHILLQNSNQFKISVVSYCLWLRICTIKYIDTHAHIVAERAMNHLIELIDGVQNSEIQRQTPRLCMSYEIV